MKLIIASIALLAFSLTTPTFAQGVPEQWRGLLAEACDKYSPGRKECPCTLSAIFKHDSSWGTAGQGARNYSPGNVRCLKNSSVPFRCVPDTFTPGGFFARFRSMHDGIFAAVELWASHYAGKPPAAQVSSWTAGGDSGYRASVNACFASA